ncbi:hypothetical protein [Tumebacillus lipolyticus]|uniref:Uncharacterized protein n=1 Tax=Tumebacillus lipolyticus TaxID=1280370 RepID=A0ABW4ZTI7_9BACL
MPVNARALLGKMVDCHTPYGVQTGILQEVRPDGIVLAVPQSTGVVSGNNDLEAEHADKLTIQNSETVFFRPFFPRSLFFIPFALLLALTLSRRRFI